MIFFLVVHVVQLSVNNKLRIMSEELFPNATFPRQLVRLPHTRASNNKIRCLLCSREQEQNVNDHKCSARQFNEKYNMIILKIN